MQHDVFVNPSQRFRDAFPFVTELQADIAEGRDRMIAPMARITVVPAIPARLTPVVHHDGQAFYVVIVLMGLLPRGRLRQAVGTTRPWHDDIIRAIDWLFTGV